MAMEPTSHDDHHDQSSSPSYTRSQWASLSIQERIRAMNNNMDLVEPTTTGSSSPRQQPQPASPIVEAAQQQQHQEEEEQVPAATAEPPRRASVVEMWRRRDNNNNQQHASSSATTPQSNKVRDRIEATRSNQEEEKKQDDESSSSASAAEHNSTSHSAVRNMWNQRLVTTTTTSPAAVKRPAAMNNHHKTRTVETTNHDEQDVDLTIVPSPSKSPSEQQNEALSPSSAISRPANVVDFWAQRGLKPITSIDESVSTTAATARKQQGLHPNPVEEEEETEQENAVDAAASPTSKVSVLDRWKQRVSGPESSIATKTATPEVTKTPTRGAVADRWKAAVQKPVAETASPSPKSKVTDRWTNRQQQQPSAEKSTPKRLSSSGASITGILPSPTSRTNTTASTTSSWRTEEHATDEDSMASPSRPTQRLAPPTSPIAPNAPATGNQKQHVTKRWSNRLSNERSPAAAPFSSPQGDDGNASQHSRFSTAYLPAPRRKSGSDLTQRSFEPKPYTSSAPSTPRSQAETRSNPRTPDSRTFLPDLKNYSPSTSLPLRPQRSTPVSPKLKIPEMKGAPRSPNMRLPDFNIYAPKSPQVNPAMTSPSLNKKPSGTLSPKLRYEYSVMKKSTPPLQIPASPRADANNDVQEPRLLVLISGQSLSRGQSAINHKIATILKGHNIPYEEIDGSILNVRDIRNDLFKISGMWAEYPQFFVREIGQTIFWGTWETLQQCNDAGMLDKEFAPLRLRGRSATGAANPDNKAAPESRSERMPKLDTKPSSTTIAPADEQSDKEYVPPLTKRKSGEPDDDEECNSIASPTRMAQSPFNMSRPRQAGARVSESLDKKKFLARKHTGNSSITQKIDEDAVLEGSSVNVEHSANISLGDDSRTDTTTAMDESVTAQTVGESVASASTAPRLGAKSLDSLERRDKKDSGTDKGKPGRKNKIIVSALDAILQPASGGSSGEQSKPKQPKTGMFPLWPPPKKSYESFSGRKAAPKSPLPRSFSPTFSPRLKMESPAGTSPSPEGSHTGAESTVSRAPGSSQVSSTLVKRDFNSPRAQRIGQKLIEKKRELQAHRQRLKMSRSNDSNDGMSSSTGNENYPSTASMPGSGSRNVLLGKVDKQQRSSIFQPRGSQAAPPDVRTPDFRPEMMPTTTPRTTDGDFFGQQTSPDFENGSPEPNFLSAANGVENHTDSFSPSRGTPWSGQPAFSPLHERSPRPEPFLAGHPLDSTRQSGTISSPKKEMGSPLSESGLSFLDIKSDGSNSVASSALSLRAEKLLKQRRQKGTLAGVKEGDEVPEGRKHAHELARNVVYGHPKQKGNRNSSEKVKKWNQLRVETTETDHSTLPPTVLSEATASLYNHAGQTNADVLGETTSMRRQRASLSSRYNTSDRFMDFDTQARPPPTTKSLPDPYSAAAFPPHSTRSAPPNGLYSESNETPNQTPCTSSEDYRSLASSTSRTDTHTSRPSMMTGTVASGNDSMRSHHGIHDDFISESAYSYDALRSAYANMTFGQLAADFAGEVSNALNLGKIQNDVKKAFEGIKESASDPTSHRSMPKSGFVCSDLVPYDEEDVAIEVEYMGDSMLDDETMQDTSYAFCEAKACGTETKCMSFDEPSRGRRRRIGEV